MQDLQIIEIKGQRVLTTKQIAELYGAEVHTVQVNYRYNKKNFQLGKHYIELSGKELQKFKDGCENYDQIKYTKQLYLWTEKGALLHAKSLNTDKAWEAYDHLVDFYFRAKERQETDRGQQVSEKNVVVPVKTGVEKIPDGIETKAGTIPLYNIDAGKVFESLIHMAAHEGIMVKFAPLRANYARIKGDRIALNSSLETIEDFNYNLAQALVHYFLHYDKGDITAVSSYKEYEEQTNRGVKMLMMAMTVK